MLELAKHFQVVTVLTGRLGDFIAPANVQVVSTEWKMGADLWNAFNIIRLGALNLIKFRPNGVFSHMADLQAALLAPLIRVLCIKHVLWYAHAYKSKYLKFASYFVNLLVSSTEGSMPLSSKKVRLIGQAIDVSHFKFTKSATQKKGRYLHVGRIDSSKQIGLICDTFLDQFCDDLQSSLTFIGSSANPKSKSYQSQIFSKYRDEISVGKIKFLGAVPRLTLPEIYSSYDVFIHAYLGSLDKTLLEATAVGLPVITINPDYQTEFGKWSPSDSKKPSLGEELSTFLTLDTEIISEEVHRRAMVLRKSHSQEIWVSKLLVLLLL